MYIVKHLSQTDQHVLPLTANFLWGAGVVVRKLKIWLQGGSVGKNPPANETRAPSPGWEDPQEKGMAPHSSGLAWEIPQTEEPGRLQSTGSQRVGHN